MRTLLFVLFFAATAVAEDGVARFTVPENRKSGSERRLRLAYVRLKSTSATPGSPIVYLAGGPGGSGIAWARGNARLVNALREIADVVGFDQRGTGLSGRLPAAGKAWLLPSDKPADRAAMLEGILAKTREAAKAWRAQGIDLAAYNTNENADDLDELRRALGVKKISLLGTSYGSHLALAMIRRHPGSIDRAVLAGVEGPDHTIKLPSSSQQLLERIDKMLKADPDLRRQFPDFLGDIRTVLDRLEKEPVSVTVGGETFTVGKFDVQLVTSQFLRGPPSLRALPLFFRRMMRGDFSGFARWIERNRRWEVWDAMNLAMDCASGISDVRALRVARERTETLLEGAINFPYPELIDAVGVPDLGAKFRADVRSDLPVLLISGTLDGRTPVRNATDVLRGFRNGVHLIVDGAGHGRLLRWPAVEKAIAEYFAGRGGRSRTVHLPPLKFAR